MATTRATRMAASGVMSHDAAGGNLGTALTRAGLPWLGYGEIIGESSYAYGTPSGGNLYGMWKASAPHHAIMFSASYNYMGAGFVRRSDGTTWASVVFTKSPDHTNFTPALEVPGGPDSKRGREFFSIHAIAAGFFDSQLACPPTPCREGPHPTPRVGDQGRVSW